MRKWTILLAMTVVMSLLLACGQKAPAPIPSAGTTTGVSPELMPSPAKTSSDRQLTPNPVETSKPIYGGTLNTGYWIPRTFDAHQKAGYGPTATLPVFNQLVMFDINYKETILDTIIGDLADSWETSPDSLNITFHLRQGVKWHDGVPFTADDVVYSLDKMTDLNRSAIADWFPAYDHTEKVDDYTVKVHLKYASASFMMALAQGESQIQSLHMAGADDQSAAFMVGTGPFILTEYIPQVNLKYKRNPNYFKKDKYGNHLPYLDGRNYYQMQGDAIRASLISRRLDVPDIVTGAFSTDTYHYLKNGAPELLWQKRERYNGEVIFLNLKRKPLGDVRIRRAIGLVLNENDLIIGSTGDVMFGIPGAGILHPALGLPEEEVAGLMGWDKPYEERVAEAQRLMAEAGYPEGFKLDMLTTTSSLGGGATTVLADELHKYLKIDVKVSMNLGTIGTQKRLDEGDYDTYQVALDVIDPVQLSNYFGSGRPFNYANYSNHEMDKMLADIDHILDPAKRQEAVRAVERILLTDLPALPTGHFPINSMPHYPWVKNIRWNNISYSNTNRLEDVWLDESLRVK